jgi:mRNA-degrading endonuclease toxin of MazEF toxin-antitoxin module
MAGFAVALAGTRTSGVVRCDQPRALDFAARKNAFVEQAPQAVIDDVLARMRTLI